MPPFSVTRTPCSCPAGGRWPHPEPYLVALKRAALHPQRGLAVEDSERGVTAAVAAGLACAAIPGGFNAGGDFAAARWRLERASQLPELLELG